MSSQQQQLMQNQQRAMMTRLLVKIIKANGLADGDFGKRCKRFLHRPN